MCFSAGASFGASAVLAGVGVAAIKRSGKSPQRLLAAIPLLFAVQQLAEGFVWMSLMHTGYASLQMPTVYFYVFFAYAVWPVYIPLSFLLMEINTPRKKILWILFIAGIIEMLYTIVCLFLYTVRTSVSNHHIVHTFNYPPALSDLIFLRDGIYFIATLPAAFISSRKGAWIFGVMLIASYVVSEIFFRETVVSVWCYFAAALSVIIFFLIKKNFTEYHATIIKKQK
jgi:hypothetical protein